MRRARISFLITVALALVALCAPSAFASSATYAWSMPGDFTSTGTGANPDRDQYGGTPWSYRISDSASDHNPANFTPLDSFSTSDPTYGDPGWSYSGDSTAFIGVNSGAGTMTLAPATSTSRAVALQWTSPVSGTVTVDGSISQSGAVCLSSNWSLDLNGSVQSTSSTLSKQLTVAVGDRIDLVVSPDANPLDGASCNVDDATLTITAPHVLTMQNPSPAQVHSQTMFAGTTDLVEGTVVVDVFDPSDTAHPVEQIPAAIASDGTWSTSPPSPMPPDGSYVIQAEQTTPGSDVFSPNAPTEQVESAPPVTLGDPGAYTQSRPTFTVTGRGEPHDTPVTVEVYAGPSPTGTPVATRTAPPGATTSVTPGTLPDGQYTVQAAQSDGLGDTGYSAAYTFNVVSAPTVTLNDPGSPTGPEPTFTGTAGTQPGDTEVTVDIYSGASASGTPLQTLTVPPAGDGDYAVTASSPLADGQYTAQASQSDALGDTGVSAPVTFVVETTAAPVTLNSPGAAPLTTATPTLSGTAGTRAGDSQQVSVLVYSGPSPAGTAVRTLSAVVASDGSYAVTVTPGLPDGQYTAVASQAAQAGNGQSAPRTFRVKVNPPAVTLNAPAPGERFNNVLLTFSGQAGDALGDSSHVTVSIYSGSSATGPLLASVTVTRNGATWSARWPRTLGSGTYTARAFQGDDAGHTGASAPLTFSIVPMRRPIGASITLSRSRMVSLDVTCPAVAPQRCEGLVLVLTKRSYRPVRSGPSGKLRVLFAYVTIPGGRTLKLKRRVSRPVARVLHVGRVKVVIEAVLYLPDNALAVESVVRRLSSR